ncbi:MAG: MBOAT family protein [Lentisphaerae bacterium]|nr:MBOAT family protein [Lentisphaerota bacterium]
MSFNSFQFLAFFTAVFALYHALNHRWQNRLLLAGSYLFYASWDWRFLSLILVSTVTDYLCGRAIGAAGPKARKRFLALSVAVNLGLLGFFKYYDFFAGSLQALLGRLGWEADVRLLHIVLPVGISFYTFQTLSYTLDVYRGTLKPARRFLDYALYVAFFPQLVAGPIERAARLLPQVQRPRRVSAAMLGEGLFLMLHGYFQKVVVADNLGLFVDRVFDAPAPQNGLIALFAVYGFAFQIFCDFAGYSNIARGAARCLGFDLMVNFRSPYLAADPRDFWRRWHISLSTWLRDYLYISLGGSRAGRIKTLRNIGVTMLLGGLWHGAAWTFVLWGAYHGLLLIVQRAWEWAAAPRRPRAVWLRRAACFHLVCLGWILFRSAGLAQAAALAGSVFRFGAYRLEAGMLPWLARLGPLVGLVVLVQVLQERTQDTAAVWRLPLPARVAAALVFSYSIILFGVHHGQTFIYFQF